MKSKKIPLRKCVACQENLPKKSLIRVVRTSDGEIRIDPTGKVSGRGAYLCKKAECFGLAKKKKALERALQAQVSDEVYEHLRTEWERTRAELHES